MKLIILTGLSGAGKTLGLRKLEDCGYFCVDNLPPRMLPEFADFCKKSEEHIEKAAVVVDSRLGGELDEIFNALSELQDMGVDYEIMFLDCNDESLVKRYKGTRRMHPLAKSGSLFEGIDLERQRLNALKEIANMVIDTSNLNQKQLEQRIEEHLDLGGEGEDEDLMISVMTFGYKHGIPLDADMVLDVRFLPNPFYVEELKPYSGKNALVKKYIFEFPHAGTFMDKLYDLVDFLVPLYTKEGKKQLIIAIGCTGGMHRSVAVAELLYERLKINGRGVMISHRDLEAEGIEINS
ncbi:MAG: RNase adapter RapZ [Christensenellales bacterium]|jgi:UPF0042 nucleotide-binding protein